MQIKVLFFAQLKDKMGTPEKYFDVRDGISVGEFGQFLFSETELSPLKGLPVQYSVNEDFVSESRELQDRDTVALLPPVAGGA